MCVRDDDNGWFHELKELKHHLFEIIGLERRKIEAKVLWYWTMIKCNLHMKEWDIYSHATGSI